MISLVPSRPRAVILLVAFFLISQIVGVQSGQTSQQKQQMEREVSFSKEIEPIIRKHCITCHTAEEEHPSELYMDSYESLLKGGRHGKAVLGGKAKESLLYQKLLPRPPFGRTMPPSRKLKLSEDQIELIRLWIEQGAKEN